VTRTARGSVVRTKTPMAFCASTSPKVRISADTVPTRSPRWLPRSTPVLILSPTQSTRRAYSRVLNRKGDALDGRRSTGCGDSGCSGRRYATRCGRGGQCLACLWDRRGAGSACRCSRNGERFGDDVLRSAININAEPRRCTRSDAECAGDRCSSKPRCLINVLAAFGEHSTPGGVAAAARLN